MSFVVTGGKPFVGLVVADVVLVEELKVLAEEDRVVAVVVVVVGVEGSALVGSWL